MTRFVTEQTIARSADDVWTYATDVVRHPQWMTITDARIIQGDGSKIGDRGRERMRFGPFGWDVEFEVAEAVPGRRIVWKAVGGAPFDLAVSLDLEPVGPTSTKATYAADIRLHRLWGLLGPIVAMEGKAGPERELRRLKAQVEEARNIAPAIS
jgi:uncharacterized protein YndB with AHSA1/START domain